MTQENNYLRLQQGERDCGGRPWDGPFLWRQFLRNYDFDFLGAAGNAEVTDGPEYGSAAIWADHQRHMHEWYMERIYNRNKGACRGYYNATEPGSVEEYGERFSCTYQQDHHVIFLGWWQGSYEKPNGGKPERDKSIEFIHREFSNSKTARWRYCVHHMTSAKLSAGGGANRDQMILSGITDACRSHGAIIVNGHHHMYSRTKVLAGVGSSSGEEPIEIADNQNVIEEGVTLSLTVGMGGYDGSCNGKYKDAAWIAECVASARNHRGAVIAEFDEETPYKGTFRYLNSLANASVVDEFVLESKINERITVSPTERPSSDSPSTTPTLNPSSAPSSNETPGAVPLQVKCDQTPPDASSSHGEYRFLLHSTLALSAIHLLVQYLQ